jgi:hypothetical protein
MKIAIDFFLDLKQLVTFKNLSGIDYGKLKLIDLEGGTMMKRILGGLILGMVTVALIGGLQAISRAASPEDMCVPMDKIVIKAPEGIEAKRSAVAFPHAQHFDIACITCHHTWGRTEPIVGCMTSGCHDLAEIPKKKPGEPLDEDSNIAYFKAAYHKLCITCHKEIKVKNLALQRALKTLDKPLPKSGPTSCLECHPK